MLPNYPSSIPAFSTLSTSDSPRSSDFNEPNRELEAVLGQLGSLLKTISGPVLPVQSPLNVAAFADMAAYIVRAMTATGTWTSAAVPSRGAIVGHAAGAVLTAGSTRFLYMFTALIPTTTEGYTRCYVPYACRATVLKAQILAAYSGTLPLVLTLRNNGVDQALTCSFTSGSTAMSMASGTGSISLAAGDYITLKMVNGSTATATVGGVAIEVDQKG